MKCKILIIFFTINSFTVYGSSIIDNYLIALKNHKYKTAIEIADNLVNESLIYTAKNLANELYFFGQKKTVDINYTKTNNKLLKVLFLLHKGHKIIHKNPYSSEPFEVFNESLKLSKEINNKELIKFCLLSIIKVYNFEISQTNEDVVLFLKEYKNLISDYADEYHYKINILLFNLRDVFFRIKLNEDFDEEFENLMQKFTHEHKFWSNYYSTIGVLYETKDELSEAVNYHNKAIEIIKNEPYLRYIKFRSNIRLSEIMKSKKKYSEALKFIKEAEKFMDKSDFLRSQYYIDLYSSDIYFKQSDYKKAYQKLDTAFKASTILDYKKNSIEIARQNVKYRTKEKELQIIQEQQKKKQNRNIAFGLAGLLLFGSLIFFLIQKNTKRKQLLAEQEKELQIQRVGTLMKEQELASIDAMIAGQEKERQRIANDLHDDLGGMMATVKLHFNTLKDKPSAELYDKTNSLLDEAYQKVRSIAHAKNSGVIAKEGLLKSVSNMVQKISSSSKISIDVMDHGLENRLENSLELTIFRIIQELVTNVIKHSNATEATIHLTQHEDRLNIMVEDNGKGFNPNTISKAQGMGIGSIDKRVDHLNGTLQIDSKVGRGTNIIIDIPI